ncbi:hypothetical protein GCM10017044_19560 [Kordiimonas sediminis]|uniref:DUF4440 domain-containing protein n=1 Tax=Kordiimonas sediminis TaxID=1735581 RepID=A0A919ATI9_9PROT|nr:nuclear transport factor 2 family protein [Kordiimonas sediminis]GHF24889.1 hypothetical protein GCM10017044_19560 [Kordiimonas sediminis]
MMRIVSFVLALLISSTVSVADEAKNVWSKEQQEIIELNRWVAMAPKEAGYEAYAALFHPDYTNWYMEGDQRSIRTRDAYLDAVKSWLDAGNYATYSKIVPVSVDIIGDVAYIRNLAEEHFHHPDQDPTKFVGHFVSLMKKHEGKWTFYRTSFQTRYRGPIEGAEISLEDY